MIDHPFWPIACEIAAMLGVNIVFANFANWVQATPAASVLVFIGTLIHAYVFLRRDGYVRQLQDEIRQLRSGRVDPEAETREYVVKKSHKS